MIERLMNQELPYGEPEYSEISKKINSLMERIAAGMDEDSRKLLEQLADLHTHRANIVAEATFIAGFCAAMDLMLDYLRQRET